MAAANYSLGQAVLGTKADLTGLERDLGRAESKTKHWLGNLGDVFKTGLGTAFGHLISGGVSFILDAIGRIAGAVQNLGAQMIGGNASFEVFVTKLEVLLGSAEAAQKRIDELAKFAAKTPFEIPDVVEASTILQNFGGDALATGDGLTLVGDLASGANVKFAEMAVTAGRLYSAIQAGKPFGEAAMRMQELGIATGTDMDLLRQMQEEGKSATEIWAKFVEIAGGKFGGMMDKQSKTFEGMISNLQDWFNTMLRTIGAPIFEAAKSGLGRLLDWLARPEVKVTVQKLADMLGKVATTLLDMLVPAAESFLTAMLPVINFIADWVMSGTVLNQSLQGLPKPIQDIIMWVVRATEDVTRFLDAITGGAPLTSAAFGLLGIAIYHLQPIIEPLLARLGELFNTVVIPAVKFVGQVLSTQVIPAFERWSQVVFGQIIPSFVSMWNWLQQKLLPAWLGLKNAFQAAGDLISAVWNVIVAAFNLGGRIIGAALKPIIDYLAKEFHPILLAIQRFWNQVFMPALIRAFPFLKDLMHGFEGIANVLKNLTKFLNDFAKTLNGIKVPPVLTPGSPTPFEMGLRGIVKTMKQVDKAMPSMMDGDLTLSRNLTMALAGSGAGGGNIQIYGNVTQQIPGRDATNYEVFKELDRTRPK